MDGHHVDAAAAMVDVATHEVDAAGSAGDYDFAVLAVALREKFDGADDKLATSFSQGRVGAVKTAKQPFEPGVPAAQKIEPFSQRP